MVINIKFLDIMDYSINLCFNKDLNNNSISNNFLYSPMDQFEIKPFFGEFLGLNFTPVGLFTNILVYIGLVVTFTIFFYLYGSFKDSIKINGCSFSIEAIYY